MAKEAAEKKVKRPTAEKRNIQSEKARLRNRTFKSRVKTAIRQYEEVLPKGEAAASASALNEIYSLMDKGVKKGIYKENTASRTKSRLAARVSK